MPSSDGNFRLVPEEGGEADGALLQVEFAADVLAVGLDGIHGNVQAFGDFLARAALSDQAGNAELRGGKGGVPEIIPAKPGSELVEVQLEHIEFRSALLQAGIGFELPEDGKDLDPDRCGHLQFDIVPRLLHMLGQDAEGSV